jgi:hypothetical protein
MGKFKELCVELEEKIQKSYEEGVTLESAERLAGEFLSAQIKVSEELKNADLDSRLRKTGVKAVRAAIYLDIVQKAEKKPTEAQIEAIINVDKIVGSEQEAFDKAEVERDNLERYYNIFREAHIHYRGISKGKFE